MLCFDLQLLHLKNRTPALKGLNQRRLKNFFCRQKDNASTYHSRQRPNIQGYRNLDVIKLEFLSGFTRISPFW